MHNFWMMLLALAALTSHLAEASTPLRVLQFNAWQLRAFDMDLTKDRLSRLKMIPDYVSATGADVITFSEVWKNKTKKQIARELYARGYAYSHYEPRGLSLGDGLLVVSKFPILDVSISRPWHPRTRPDEIISQKRSAKVTVDIPNVGSVDIFQAHMGAVSFSVKKDAYDKKEKISLENQFDELASFISESATSKFIILAADLNAHYQKYDRAGNFKPEYAEDYLKLIRNACPDHHLMENSFLEANGLTVKDKAVSTYSSTNPYVTGGFFAGIPTETEDYILYCPNPNLKPVQSKVIFDQDFPESDKEKFNLKVLPARLSDHFGLVSDFEIN